MFREENNQPHSSILSLGGGGRGGCATYIVAVNLLLAEFFHQLVNLVLGGDQVISKDLLVQSAGVGDDHGHIPTNVSQVSQCGGHVAIADNLIVA